MKATLPRDLTRRPHQSVDALALGWTFCWVLREKLHKFSALILVWGVSVILGVASLVMWSVSAPESRDAGREVPLSNLLSQIDADLESQVFVDSGTSSLVVRLSSGTYAHAVLEPMVAQPVIENLVAAGHAPSSRAKESKYAFMREGGSLAGFPVVPPLWLAALMASVMFAGFGIMGFSQDRKISTASRSLAQVGGAQISMRKSSAPLADRPPTRFSDVVGCDEAVLEVQECIDVLDGLEHYALLNARAPRGILLAGPPGVGKTLLARAAAGEAGASFFAASGTDFVEMYVGVGASRVRDLFRRARQNQPSVVFIDEIDAVGKSRATPTAGTGSHEWEATLNALLVEMDGFHQGDRVLVLAATNRPEVLDSALVRPGRFDKKIHVPLPDALGRHKLLDHYLSDKPVAAGVDTEALARRCSGMSGADIAQVANEAAIVAARRRAQEITLQDIEEAVQTSMVGRARKSRTVSESDRQIVAHHEAGHALVAWCTPGAVKPEFVTIVPRGASGGATWMRPRESMMTRSAAMADLSVLLAGRAAESILLDGDFTSGAADDLRRATELATRMVFEFGMHDALSVRDRRLVSTVADDSHRAVDAILDEAFQRALNTIEQSRNLLDALVAELLTSEEVSRTRLEEIWTSEV